MYVQACTPPCIIEQFVLHYYIITLSPSGTSYSYTIYAQVAHCIIIIHEWVVYSVGHEGAA